MSKNALFIVVACCLMMACGKKPMPKQKVEAISTFQNLPGDSTLYGLACEGCTDSILILLPYAGGDPDTFNIISTAEEHRIYGRPHIGDEMAVIPSSDSIRGVRIVINMSTLKGQWCYMASPTLRHHAKAMPPIPDSIRQRLMLPREYGIRLKNGGVAFSTGVFHQQEADAMSPVVYPTIKFYNGWKLHNGQLILLTDSTRQQLPDTVTIQLLRRDSLVLRFKDHAQSFYRKKDDKAKK